MKNHLRVSVFLLFSLALMGGCASPQKSFWKAERNNNLKAVKKAIKKGANVNEKSYAGQTALMNAADFGRVDMVRLLIENGAIINEKDEKGKTALLHSILEGHANVARLLIERGANMNEKDADGKTLLMQAAFSGHIDIIKLLIEKGADVNEKNQNGFTTLMEAARGGQVEAARLLIEKGADIDTKNNTGRTALMVAAANGGNWQRENGQGNVALLLIKNGANINEKDYSGETVLIIATKCDALFIIKTLIENGANLFEKDSSGRTAFEYTKSGSAKNIFEEERQRQMQLIIESFISKSPIPIAKKIESQIYVTRDLRKQLSEANKLAVKEGIQVDYKIIKYELHYSSSGENMIYVAEAQGVLGNKLIIFKFVFGGDILFGEGGRMKESRYVEGHNPTQLRSDLSKAWIYNNADGFLTKPNSFMDYPLLSELKKYQDRLEESADIWAIVWVNDMYLPPEEVYVAGNPILHFVKSNMH